MTAFLTDYGLFLAKTLTLLLALVFIVMMIAANAARHRQGSKARGHLCIVKLNDELEDMKDDIRHEILDTEVLKHEEKLQKKQDKAKQKAKQKELKAKLANNETAEGGTDSLVTSIDEKARVFVIDFDGDTAASAVEDLRNVITAVLQVARCERDEVMLRLESPGGMVHAYGLAASQLQRLRKHKIRLTICVDKVAASGGYMMACIADRLLAAPFAYIGSIGVLVQLPNVHRLLKDHKVDFEMITAGEYKRTLTAFGENTDQDRAKVQEEVDAMHQLFKDFILTYRPALNITKVATGEVWSGTQSLSHGLIDAIDTSDEWLLEKCKEAEVFELTWERQLKLADRLSSLFEGSLLRAFRRLLAEGLQRSEKEKFFS